MRIQIKKTIKCGEAVYTKNRVFDDSKGEIPSDILKELARGSSLVERLPEFKESVPYVSPVEEALTGPEEAVSDSEETAQDGLEGLEEEKPEPVVKKSVKKRSSGKSASSKKGVKSGKRVALKKKKKAND